MPQHCTSFALSRRDFLKTLLISISGLAGISGMTHATPATATPIWVQHLTDNRPFHPPQLPIPHGLPGSLMKLVASAALLEEHIISPNTRLECRGSLHQHGQAFACEHPHGKLTLQEAIGFSCNLFFAQAANALSIRRFLQYAQQFQLDQPASSAPFIFPSEITNTQPAPSYALGLNRNLQPNALQLTRLAGLIAQRGIKGFHPQTWQILQQGMRLATLRGTAAELDPDNHLQVAAKTGTTRHGHTFQSWLIGYFPFEHPRYAFCLRAPVGTGKEQAVPLARRYLLSQTWA